MAHHHREMGPLCRTTPRAVFENSTFKKALKGLWQPVAWGTIFKLGKAVVERRPGQKVLWQNQVLTVEQIGRLRVWGTVGWIVRGVRCGRWLARPPMLISRKSGPSPERRVAAGWTSVVPHERYGPHPKPRRPSVRDGAQGSRRWS